MSALDQAFIKAFAKEPPTAPRTTPREAQPSAYSPQGHAQQPQSEPILFDELYDAGTFYRVDASAEKSVPAAHLPEQKVPRRLQRRGGARIENRADDSISETPPPAPAVEPNPHALPPRRQWSQSMLEIARQLARLDLRHTPLSELPPEIVYIEPPLPEAPPEPAPPAEQNSLENLELEFSPQTIANLWPVDAFIPQSQQINLAQAETWLAAPIAPAVVCNAEIVLSPSSSPNTPCSANEAETTSEPPAGSAAPVATAPTNIEASFKATINTEPAAEKTAEVAAAADPKAKKKFRIDSSHSRVSGPHTKPAVEANDVARAEHEELLLETDSPAKQPEKPADKPAAEPVAEAPAPIMPKRPYVPLWEVDRFTWPALCDKLMNDRQGYFASASNKLLSVVRGGLKVLGITGSRRGEGRTTLALCLARAAAQAGIHVALVDADFARPQLATMLGLETAYGWQEAATGKIPLSEAAVKSLADRLTVLPLEVSTSTAKLSLADPRVTATLRATAATFELVIVDLGPLGNSSEPLFPPGENCPLDAAVVVRDVRYSLVGESRATGDRLYDAGIEAVGIAENFVTQPELAFL